MTSVMLHVKAVIAKRVQRLGPAVSKPLINAAGMVIKAVMARLIWLNSTPNPKNRTIALVARKPRLTEGEYQILRRKAGDNVINPHYSWQHLQCNANIF